MAGRSYGPLILRAAVLLFAASLILPVPRYLQGLASGEFVVWLARLIWVVGLIAVFFVVLLVGSSVLKRKKK